MNVNTPIRTAVLLLTVPLLISCGTPAVSDSEIPAEIQTVSSEAAVPAGIQTASSEAAAFVVSEPESAVESETENISETQPAEPAEPLPEPDDAAFVRMTDYLPDIQVDLRYAGDNNFTGTRIYDFTDAYLRYGTMKKLISVHTALEADGYTFCIWDAFRPVSAQFRLWEVYPDATYVANPVTGHSSHSCGSTVDLTLVHLDGSPVEMPTDFDDFSLKADRDYSDCTEQAAANARYLENLMTNAGFRPYRGEWWHFSDTDSYPVEESFDPAMQ